MSFSKVCFASMLCERRGVRDRRVYCHQRIRRSHVRRTFCRLSGFSKWRRNSIISSHFNSSSAGNSSSSTMATPFANAEVKHVRKIGRRRSHSFSFSRANSRQHDGLENSIRRVRITEIGSMEIDLLHWLISEAVLGPVQNEPGRTTEERREWRVQQRRTRARIPPTDRHSSRTFPEHCISGGAVGIHLPNTGETSGFIHGDHQSLHARHHRCPGFLADFIQPLPFIIAEPCQKIGYIRSRVPPEQCRACEKKRHEKSREHQNSSEGKVIDPQELSSVYLTYGLC